VFKKHFAGKEGRKKCRLEGGDLRTKENYFNPPTLNMLLLDLNPPTFFFCSFPSFDQKHKTFATPLASTLLVIIQVWLGLPPNSADGPHPPHCPHCPSPLKPPVWRPPTLTPESCESGLPIGSWELVVKVLGEQLDFVRSVGGERVSGVFLLS
jgi:hypothetical protein